MSNPLTTPGESITVYHGDGEMHQYEVLLPFDFVAEKQTYQHLFGEQADASFQVDCFMAALIKRKLIKRANLH